MIKQRILLPATVLAGSLGLAACGGGGSATGTPGLPVPDSHLLGVTANNYVAVGQATMSSAFYLGDAGGLLTEGGAGRQLLQQAVGTTRRALGATGVPSATPAAIEFRQTLNCSQGGTLTLSINDANNNAQVDVGDAITVDALSCREDGAVMQGRISLALQALTGSFGSNSYSATLAMTLTGFSSTRGEDTVQGDGTLNLALSQTLQGVAELTVSTPRLVLGGRYAGQAFSTTLTDSKLTVRIEPLGGGHRSSLSYSGGLASNLFADKQVQISTPQPMVTTGGEAFPSSGQMLVKGRGNSALRITPVSATHARLELDAQGDGIYETQLLKTWAELE
jgi:hypothetical protein